jgi:hypothetical protein
LQNSNNLSDKNLSSSDKNPESHQSSLNPHNQPSTSTNDLNTENLPQMIIDDFMTIKEEPIDSIAIKTEEIEDQVISYKPQSPSKLQIENVKAEYNYSDFEEEMFEVVEECLGDAENPANEFVEPVIKIEPNENCEDLFGDLQCLVDDYQDPVNNSEGTMSNENDPETIKESSVIKTEEQEEIEEKFWIKNPNVIMNDSKVQKELEKFLEPRRSLRKSNKRKRQSSESDENSNEDQEPPRKHSIVVQTLPIFKSIKTYSTLCKKINIKPHPSENSAEKSHTSSIDLPEASKHHQPSSSSTFKPHPTKKIVSIFKCTYCSERFLSQEILKQHMHETHRNKCPECEKTFPYAISVAQHLAKEHPKNSVKTQRFSTFYRLSCPVCSLKVRFNGN